MQHLSYIGRILKHTNLAHTDLQGTKLATYAAAWLVDGVRKAPNWLLTLLHGWWIRHIYLPKGKSKEEISSGVDGVRRLSTLLE